ncbi:M90 family metallopeptidase [Botrimarina mediterranea]|uniref:M90 family metallopeptidase n=1 Tax=Botrimarina mediterranea TaxID=2528022 RepID=UPI001188F975|nr:Protein MtfA [Planctomycetes bacterium K2D]
MFSWFRRRPAAVASGDWESILARNVWHYRFVPDEWRTRHGEVVARMVAERRWEGAGGLVLTDEMRVTVAGVAALMTLGYDDRYVYHDVPAIILYPGAFNARRQDGGWLDLLGGGGDSDVGSHRLGEAWRRGPIVLSWPDVIRSARRPGRGQNLVLHEFAHYVDGLNGDTDGIPMVTGAAARRWPAVVSREFDRLVAQARRGELTVLDQYGATNHAEFFAVSTECFFERPHEMRERHGELYGLMADFYRQDPSEWLPRLAPRRRVAQSMRAPMHVDVSGLGLNGADAAFAEGQALLSAGEFRAAAAALDRAIAADPNDAEALVLRAEARLGLGEFESARDDALAAIAIESDSVAAQVAAAEAFFELDDDTAADEHAAQARRLDAKEPAGWLYGGLVALNQERMREAKNLLKRAVALDPYDGDAHYWLATVCEKLGDSRSAARYYDRAELLAAAPDEADESEDSP